MNLQKLQINTKTQHCTNFSGLSNHPAHFGWCKAECHLGTKTKDGWFLGSYWILVMGLVRENKRLLLQTSMVNKELRQKKFWGFFFGIQYSWGFGCCFLGSINPKRIPKLLFFSFLENLRNFPRPTSHLLDSVKGMPCWKSFQEVAE